MVITAASESNNHGFESRQGVSDVLCTALFIAAYLHMFEFVTEYALLMCIPGLPDGLFSNQKLQFG
jgi:hypothetical protein